jgi:hypothetical protein
MKVSKSIVGIGGVFCLVCMLMVGACERKVTEVVQDNTPFSCFGCHSDEDTRLTTAEGQWENSVHASGETTNEGDRTPCNGCHTSQGFVARIDGTELDSVEHPTAIHCFTCHAPHTNGNFELRVENAWALENGVTFDLHEGNLCVSCHHSRNDVDAYVKDAVNAEQGSRFGSHHGPQGDMLIGTNGYEYEDYAYSRTFAHKSATKNGCVDCHMAQNNYFLGGHSFNVTYGEGSDEQYNTNGCDIDACHGGEIGDLDDGFNRPLPGTTTGVQDSVLTLLAELKGLLQDANLLNSRGTPVTRIVTSADSIGAVWNYGIITEDRSEGIHNPTYIIDLLKSSIEFMKGAPTASAEPTTISRR